MQRDNEYINTSMAGGASCSTSTSTVPSGGAMSATSMPPTQVTGQQGFINPPVNGHGGRKKSSTSEEDDHEYYNDYDARLKRELQPLNQHRRNETTV